MRVLRQELLFIMHKGEILKFLRRVVTILFFVAFGMAVSFAFTSCNRHRGYTSVEYSFEAISKGSEGLGLDSSSETIIESSLNDSSENSCSSDSSLINSEAFKPPIDPTENCEHEWEEYEVYIQVDCTQDGLVLYRCNKCHLRKRETVPMLEHTVVVVPQVDPTCQRWGETERRYCDECKKILLQSKGIPKVEHVFIDGIVCQWCNLYTITFSLVERPPLDPYFVCVGFAWDDYKQRDIVIPNVFDGLPVKEIGAYAFHKEYILNRITLNENLEKIGENAFSSCYNLKEVCNFSKINIIANSNESLEVDGAIGSYAQVVKAEEFETNFHKDEQGFVTYHENDEIFLMGYDGDELEIVIPEGVTTIHAFALATAKEVKVVTLANSVRNLNVYSFSQCYNLIELRFAYGELYIYPQIFMRFTEAKPKEEYIEPLPMILVGQTTGKMIRKLGDEPIGEKVFRKGEDMFSYIGTKENAAYYYVYIPYTA